MPHKNITLLGQYACGECGRKIEGNFAKLYYLGSKGLDFRLPDHDKGIIPPNVMVCKRHINYFPIGVINDSPLEDIANYGLLQSDAIRSCLWWDRGVHVLKPDFGKAPPKGYILAEAFRICGLDTIDFLSEKDVREYFPNAVKLIDNYFLVRGKTLGP